MFSFGSTSAAILLLFLGCATGSCGPQKPKHDRDSIALKNYEVTAVDFDQPNISRPQALTPAWQCGSTGGGSPVWEVRGYADAHSGENVLVQSGEGTYPWCVRPEAKLQDGFVEVAIKPISGREDMAGGIVWRWQDPSNYYITRANALEDNVTIYRTVDGDRQELKRFKIKVKTGSWATLRVHFLGNSFDVFYNGDWVLDGEDAQFVKAGSVGVWTKADSVTAFDDFKFGGE